MRRNKPQQLGVREGGAACGRRRAGRAGGRAPAARARCSGAGEGEGTPFPSGCPRPGRPLCGGTFFPTRVVLFTIRSSGGSFTICYLGGGAVWGDTRGPWGDPDCRGRTGETQFAAFWETRERGQHPHSQQLNLGPQVQGDPRLDDVQKTAVGKLRGSGCELLFSFVFACGRGNPEGRGWCGLGGGWWFLWVAGRCRVCPGNRDPVDFFVFIFFL